jgi:hypothetical protein
VESELLLSFDVRPLGPVVLQTLGWLAVVVAGLLAVRRRWVWPGLAGGLLGLGVAVTYLVDTLQQSSADRQLGAHVFDSASDGALGYTLPGFIAGRDLETTLSWLQSGAVALVAVALLTGAVLSRRRDRPVG